MERCEVVSNTKPIAENACRYDDNVLKTINKAFIQIKNTGVLIPLGHIIPQRNENTPF